VVEEIIENIVFEFSDNIVGRGRGKRKEERNSLLLP